MIFSAPTGTELQTRQGAAYSTTDRPAPTLPPLPGAYTYRLTPLGWLVALGAVGLGGYLLYRKLS